jgi:hypothetical protein
MTPKIARNATVLNLVAGHLRLSAADLSDVAFVLLGFLVEKA